MGRLASTANEHLLDLLKQDFQNINQPFPTPRKSRREAKPAATREPEGREQPKEQAKEQGRRRESIKPISIDLKELGAEGEAGEAVEESVKLRLSADIKQMLDQLNVGSSFSKISLFDVEIEISPPERELEGHEEFEYEEHEEGLEEGPPFGLYELDISKIKIGRVEFLCHPPDKPTQF